MGINGSAGWEQGLKQEARNTLQRSARSEGNARARMAANAGSTEHPGEPLVCPKCKVQYDTGLYCVDCDVELVGESFVDAVEPTARRREYGNWIIAAVALLAIGALILTIVISV